MRSLYPRRFTGVHKIDITRENEIKLQIVLAALLILGFIFLVKLPVKTETQDEPIDGWSNLCFWKTIQPGQGITENGPGEFDYTLIVTPQGIDVYMPCHE